MITVIKIGGQVVDDDALMDSFIRSLSQIQGQLVLVHGGGKIATAMAEKIGVPQKIIQGRRVTDKASLDIVAMVYAGLVNKNIVARLHAQDRKAIGLSGADGDLIRAVRRPAGVIDYGFVGDVRKVNIGFLQSLLDQGLCPVLCPLAHDGHGQLLNVNADTIAAEIAIALAGTQKVRLVYCFEKKAVMMDPDREDSAIPLITPAALKSLVQDGIVHSGMIPKLENAIKTAAQGVNAVVIGHASDIISLCAGEGGTQIVAHD